MTLIPTALTKVCDNCGATYSYDEAHSCTQGNIKLERDDLPVVEPETLLGATLGGRYYMEHCLEGGGMGVVYRARHVALDRPVAVKIMVVREPQEGAARQRFLQEAVLASRVRHSNVVDIFDFGVLEGGHLYLVMEFLQGQTLRQAMQGPMAPLRSCHIAAQIARGLQAVHDQCIIHRDLKPDNVFLLHRDGQADFVKIVDFGIAKARGGPSLTQSGMVLGTPQYMAPEQVGMEEKDHRVDQYALGCVLYRMLTGVLPFDGESGSEILLKHATEAAIPPRERRPELGLPASLEVIVLRAMSKRPEDRYGSMREMERALLREVQHMEKGAEEADTRVFALLPPARRPGPAELRWRRWLAFMSLGAVVTALLMLGVILRGGPGSAPAAVPAPGAPGAGLGALTGAQCREEDGAAPGGPFGGAPGLPLRRGAGWPGDVQAGSAAGGGLGRWGAPGAALLQERPQPEGPPAPRPRPQPLRVRFEVKGRGEVPLILSCAGHPPLLCGKGCTVEIPEGRGECVASAPGSGYRPESYTFDDLRARARGRSVGAQDISLRYIQY